MANSVEKVFDIDRPSLILASSSIYRREILKKLKIPFDCVSPDIDEQPLSGETPKELVKRLALEKAQKVAVKHPQSLIIGSDQIAVLDTKIITKPCNHQQAQSQLRQSSGRVLTFLTSLCLYNASKQQYQSTVESSEVKFLDLSDTQINHYLRKDKPYNCAGSFKFEGLGITLVAQFKGNDPNSLVGLPLIKLVSMLRQEGIEPLNCISSDSLLKKPPT